MKAQAHRSMFPPLDTLWQVMVGGMIGASARVAFAHVFVHLQNGFPWVTLAENVIGAFLLTLPVVLLHERWRPSRRLHPLLGIGILGSFTTFSAFSVETVELMRSGHAIAALLYPLVSIALGMAAAIACMWLGRFVLSREGL